MGNEELKKLSVAAMEQAIGEAISALTGAHFECDISSMEMDSWNGMKMTLALTEPVSFSDPAEAADTD